MSTDFEARTPHATRGDVASAASANAPVNLSDALLVALLAEGEPDDFLREVLGLMARFTQAERAVLRLREGERLRSRVALELAAEVDSGFAHTSPAEPAPASPRGALLDASDARVSPAMRAAGAACVYYLPCLAGDAVVAALVLSWRAPGSLTAARQAALDAFAPRLGAAIKRRLAQEALEHAVRSRDQVLAVVAHDLRNPISVISMAANSMLKKTSDSLARRPLERVIRASQRADHLIDDLLQIDAIEGGRFSIQSRRVDTADVILAALESQQTLAASASVILATDLSPQLPPIDGDAERLLEVLENLIGNAIKFTSPGGTVTVGATGRHNEIMVWVKDNGAGIAPEQQPHLFDRFFQARKADRRGTGLGLTICKAIVEAHGGRIWVDSAVGQGTTMSFSIPALAEGRPPLKDTQKAAILVVDDRPENLLSLEAILDRPDYRVVTARSGQEALSLALRERFCVALIDIAMPGMNGLEVAVHLKELERSRDIPIIFITAFGDDPQEIHRAYSAGGVDYLVKPLDTEIVRKKVAVFVDLTQRRRASDPPR